MYTSVGLLALASWLAPAPSWHTDYAAAQNKAIQEKRPLVVVVSSGQDGFDRLSQEGKINGEAGGLLAEHFVCAYLDLSNPQQARLAKLLAISSGQGIVISDRTGAVQAFHHDGKLSDDDLVRQLRHFANPAVQVRSTIGNGSSRTSFYPDGGSSGGIRYAPATTVRNC
jgi:hypothetical protein